MSMSKKLYLNFGIILAMVIVLFLVIVVAVQREHSAKAAAAQALQVTEGTDKVRSQVMQNRLYLSNYLLSGDNQQVQKMHDGVQLLRDEFQASQKLVTSEEQRAAIAVALRNEEAWVSEFAEPMLQKRKQVDSGNATVADLQIYYLQKDANTFLKTTTDALEIADHEAHKALDERQNADKSASNWTLIIALIATLVAVALGAGIAFRTARSITEPLSELIKVARQIGETGDLDHEIDIRRDDEIGQLGRTCGKMVTYLKEMASETAAISFR